MFSTSNIRSLLRTAVGFCGFALLYAAGWAGRTPWYVIAALAMLLAVLLHEPLNLALNRRLDGRLHLAISLQMLCMVAVLYATGWGSALALVGLSVMAADTRTIGSATWRPVACWGVVWLAAGEAAVAAGWVFSYLDQSERFLIDGIVGITLVNLAGMLGRGAERREREADARAIAERDLLDRQQRLDTMLGSSFELIALISTDGTIGYVSPSLEQRLGVQGGNAGSRPLDELIRSGGIVHPDDVAVAIGGVVAAMERHQSRFEVRLRDLPAEGGGWRWWEAVVTDLRADPVVAGLVANVRDVSARKHEQARLAEAALTDALTGLPNRAAFLGRLDAALDLRSAPGTAGSPGRTGPPSAVAVLFVDLDGFKAINDRLGHDWGDKLLIQVAGKLVGAVRDGELVARWAGDEFVVMADGVASASEANAVAARISDALGQCGWRVEGGDDVVVAGSVGVAMGRPGTIGAHELIRQADTAMYSIKSDRRPESLGRSDSPVSR